MIADEVPGSGVPSSFGESNPDIDRFLNVLKPDERDTMILVYGFGLSHGEASEVTGLPLGTVNRTYGATFQRSASDLV